MIVDEKKLKGRGQGGTSRKSAQSPIVTRAGRTTKQQVGSEQVSSWVSAFVTPRYSQEAGNLRIVVYEPREFFPPGSFDSVVVPFDEAGRMGTFGKVIGEHDSNLASRLKLATSQSRRSLLARQRKGSSRAAEVDGISGTQLIAAWSGIDKPIGVGAKRATFEAINIAIAAEASSILMPILGIGAAQRDPAQMIGGMVDALEDVLRDLKRPLTIYFASASVDGLILLQNALLKFSGTHVGAGSAERDVNVSLNALTNRSNPAFRADRGDDDYVGVGAEIQAFAKLAAFRDVPLPLAVGVFGDWGSGKSFFMGKVRQQVEAFAEQARNEDTPETKANKADKTFIVAPNKYYANIVQIEFNAWHYIEANLWASLVEFIFSKLEEWLRRKNDKKIDKVGALFETLATSRQLKLDTARAIMTANAELLKAQKEVEAAEKAKAAKLADQKQAALAFLNAGLAKLFDDKNKDVLKAHLDKAGLAKAGANYDEVISIARRLKEETGRSQLLLQSAHAQLSSRWGMAAIASLVVLPVVVPLAFDKLFGLFDVATPAMADLFSGFSAIAATLIGTGHRILGVAKPALDEAEKFMAEVEAEKTRLQAEQLKTEEKSLSEARASLAASETALTAAQERLRQASEQAALARTAYHAESARGRLNRFIRERLADGTYGKHLGLIATIRKDFEQLTNLIEATRDNSEAQVQWKKEEDAYQLRVKALEEEANKDKENPLLTSGEIEALKETTTPDNALQTFDRIILYIDDLDRCPPEKVVEVIQAVHMLLSFRLFVVFVAVDARWVSQALTTVYEKQLKVEDGTALPADEGLNGQASPSDYMEKIFQIPYWVRPLRGEAAGGFMIKLVDDFGVEREEEPTLQPPANPVQSAIAAQSVSSDQISTKAIMPSETDLPAKGGKKDKQKEDGGDADLGGNASTTFAKLEKLKLVEADLAALTLMAPLVGESPRRIKRFFNTYLLIQTISSVTLDGDATDIDPAMRAAFREMLTHCSFAQQTLALATSLALAMQVAECGLTPAQVADLPDKIEWGSAMFNTGQLDIKHHGVQKILEAFVEARNLSRATAFPDGHRLALEIFMPIARRYGFRDVD